ncbi:MAG: flagellar biosynthesis anti-sigma factor FlgM [Ruminococcus sp.]|jgi:anti-sigma28 factor (negative regulator of flagellin synthesis)|nr:flagellar biosynthesis anti-sigma factor FlgM [Ruminococcus sp.]
MQNNPVANSFITNALSGYNKISAKRPERAGNTPKRSDVFVLSSQTDITEKVTYAANDIASGIRAADDSAKAEAIKAKIKSGNYNVSAEEVAKSILGII